MMGVLSKVFQHLCRQKLPSFSSVRSRICHFASSAHAATSNNSTDNDAHPVWSCNEWDPLKEIVVGRAEGQRVPSLAPDLQVSCSWII